jgi:DNA replication initiation complex subunit (GINS family)
VSFGQHFRTRGKHRGQTPRQLIQTIGRLEREANAATCQIVALATEVDQLTAERNELSARLDETVLANQAAIDDLTAERDELLAELAAVRAVEANAHRITVPPMVRDTAVIEDQATEPIPVLPLREAAAAGLLGPVTDPGRITL